MPRCKTCLKSKPSSLFDRRNKATCKRCRADRMTRKRNTRRDKMRRFKEATPCTDCKTYFEHYLMDFDHVTGPKKYNISDLMNKDGSTSEETFLAELAKCELVCVMCHRKRTYRRKQAA